MNLVDKKVIHETFGKGNVLKCNDSYIKINFESGDKKFIFPDVFSKYIKFVDQKPAEIVKKKIAIKEQERKKQRLILKKERALEQERRNILKLEKSMKNNKTNDRVQSVFWCGAQEKDEIFADWKVFTGEIKSGQRKGQPRRLIRMNQKSACLITQRESNEPEENRRILGLFMAEEFFNGRSCKDGYIIAHSKYRLQLSEQESKDMLFWKYYMDGRFPDQMTWNSGRQRYFDNIWTAQILQDIVSLKEKSQEHEQAQEFLEYFCRLNYIDKNQIPKANGPLLNI